jgi:hypothetical protein
MEVTLMAPAPSMNDTRPAFNESLDSLEALFQPTQVAARDDFSLCFLCLRWTSGDHDCRSGIRCDLQLTLDRLEDQS